MADYDVIIVGAGTGGSIAAAGLAHKGFKVLLFDRHPKEDIGVKICGDATSTDHFKRIEPIVNIEPPSKKNKEVIQDIKGAWLFSPDKKVKLELIEEGSTGVIIDRFKMGMRILDTAIDNGVVLLDDTYVKEPIIEHDQVVGVRYRGKDRNTYDAKGKVIVDASGVGAILRTQLDPEKTFMDKEISPKDLCTCYRELRDVENEIESPEFIRLMFDQDICPGGYIWEFPRGPRSVNVGLGVMKINKLNPRKQYDLFLESKKDFYKNSKLVHGGGWPVPLRRPQDNLVWNGFILIGDSGTQVKPTDGGGIGISANAAAMATKTITKAIENDNVSMANLWEYSVEFMKTIAPITAPLAIMKDFIIPMPSSLINEVFHKNVVEAEDLLHGNATGNISSNFLKTLERIWRGKTMIGTLLKFRTVLKRMDKARQLYENYPSTPNNFLPWREKIHAIFGEKIN